MKCQHGTSQVQGVLNQPSDPVNKFPSDNIVLQIQLPQCLSAYIIMSNRALLLPAVEHGFLKILKPSLHNVYKAIKTQDLKQQPDRNVSSVQNYMFGPLFGYILTVCLPSHQF